MYTILEPAFDICKYERTDGLILLREKMATAKYELMEKYAVCSRKDIGDPKEYWNSFLDQLVASTHGHYDEEIETTAQYVNKALTTPEDAFSHLKHLKPNLNNAFLFRHML